MPWTMKSNSEYSYNVSAFAKEEIPTWAEIVYDYYEKIYCTGDHIYDGSNPGELDHYWKIPHKKYIIAIVCNQFNKMIMEDGYKDDLLKHININAFSVRLNANTIPFNIRFGIRLIHNMGLEHQLTKKELHELEDTKFRTPELISAIAGTPPYIYTFKNPKGTVNPFITNHPRIDISTIHERICLYPIIKVYSDKKIMKDNYFIYTPLPYIDGDKEVYNDIIEWMMKPYKEYMLPKPGWKDENGNLIETSILEPTIGYDPAL